MISELRIINIVPVNSKTEFQLDIRERIAKRADEQRNPVFTCTRQQHYENTARTGGHWLTPLEWYIHTYTNTHQHKTLDERLWLVNARASRYSTVVFSLLHGCMIQHDDTDDSLDYFFEDFSPPLELNHHYFFQVLPKYYFSSSECLLQTIL